MKKLIAVIITTLLFSQAVLASGIDLGGMTADELIALKTAITQELMDRGEIKSANVPAGDYIVGEDIPAGSYSISTSQIMVTVTVNDYEQMFVVTPDDGVGKISLSDGDAFTCSSTIVLETYAGLAFE